MSLCVIDLRVASGTKSVFPLSGAAQEASYHCMNTARFKDTETQAGFVVTLKISLSLYRCVRANSYASYPSILIEGNLGSLLHWLIACILVKRAICFVGLLLNSSSKLEELVWDRLFRSFEHIDKRAGQTFLMFCKQRDRSAFSTCTARSERKVSSYTRKLDMRSGLTGQYGGRSLLPSAGMLR